MNYKKAYEELKKYCSNLDVYCNDCGAVEYYEKMGWENDPCEDCYRKRIGWMFKTSVFEEIEEECK